MRLVDFHTLAINSDGELWAWGNNNFGQLGLGSTTPYAIPRRVGTSTNWASVACGQYYTAAIDEYGNLYTCGKYAYGALGRDTSAQAANVLGIVTHPTNPRTGWKTVACGAQHTLAIDIDGKLYSFGHNQSGELGINESGISTSKDSPQLVNHPENKTYKQIACGDYTSIAIGVDNKLYLWGRFVANTGGTSFF